MGQAVKIEVSKAPFDSGAELKALQGPSVGGVAVFVGVVRDENDSERVNGLFLEHYPGMTEKQIAEIVAEALARWQLHAVTVIHRVGQLHPGDEIVFVGTGSAHRGDAFDACEYIIDFLKTRATFWKRESISAGERWLTTRESDVLTAREWAGKQS